FRCGARARRAGRGHARRDRHAALAPAQGGPRLKTRYTAANGRKGQASREMPLFSSFPRRRESRSTGISGCPLPICTGTGSRAWRSFRRARMKVHDLVARCAAAAETSDPMRTVRGVVDGLREDIESIERSLSYVSGVGGNARQIFYRSPNLT